MLEIRQAQPFSEWMAGLRDSKGRAVIARRIERLSLGNFGDYKPVGDGVLELRVDFGPGYRVYFTRRGREIVILLCGGDKSSQAKDIARAKAVATQLRERP